MVAEVKIPSGPAAGFFDREVRGITVDMETHIAGVIADGGIGVGGDVVEELVDGFVCSGCCGGLFGGDCVECDEHRAVDCSCVIEEGSDDALDACYFGWWEDGEIGLVDGVLYFGAVVGAVPLMRRVLWLRRRRMRASA